MKPQARNLTSRNKSDSEKDAQLLRRYVSSWRWFSDMPELSSYQVPAELTVGTNEFGESTWQPLECSTAPTALALLCDGLGLPGTGATRLPPLYEQLVLSFRWATADLGRYRLLPNWPASDLGPLLTAMCQHDELRTTFQPNGYVQFAQGPDTNYDAVCFDFRHRQKNGDCRVVQLDHEANLCDFCIQETAELATSFRELVIQTIQEAEKRRAHLITPTHHF